MSSSLDDNCSDRLSISGSLAISCEAGVVSFTPRHLISCRRPPISCRLGDYNTRGLDEFVGIHFDLGKSQLLTVNFFSVDADFRWSGDAEADLVPIHGHNGNGNATIDDNLFADFP